MLLRPPPQKKESYEALCDGVPTNPAHPPPLACSAQPPNRSTTKPPPALLFLFQKKASERSGNCNHGSLCAIPECAPQLKRKPRGDGAPSPVNSSFEKKTKRLQRRDVVGFDEPTNAATGSFLLRRGFATEGNSKD